MHAPELVPATEVPLHDLATCLHDPLPPSASPTSSVALNLDSGPLTALCVAGLPPPSVLSERAPVRDRLVVVAP